MTANRSFAAISWTIPFRLPALGLWPVAAWVTAFLEAGSVRPQQVPPSFGQDTVAAGISEPSNGLIHERESFVYTARQRDPFVPPKRSTTTGAVTDAIRLLGIIRHDRADLGVVLLDTMRTAVDETDSRVPGGNPPQAVRLRLGQTLGDMRLTRIHSDHIVLEADVPTGVVRRVLRVPRTNERIPS